MIGVREKSRDLAVIKESLESLYGRPEFVTFDEDKLEGSLTRYPLREEMPQEIEDSFIVEFYNR